MLEARALIGPDLTEGGGPPIEVRSPFTEEIVGSALSAVPDQLDRAVTAARRAFDTTDWARGGVEMRERLLLTLSERLSERVEELVEAQILEAGLTRRFIDGLTREMVAPAVVLEEGATARAALAETTRSAGHGSYLVTREPVGVVVQIVAWNGPVPAIIGKLLPALLAGCTVVVKSPEAAPLSAGIVAECLAASGLPPGVVNLVHGGAAAGKHLVAHPDVDHVSFTGSTAVGRMVGESAGAQLKTMTLELGGKSAAILLDDVDIARTASRLVRSSLRNSGQACWATTRVIVPSALSSDVGEALSAAFANLVVGDPSDPSSEIGPLVSSRQRDRVEGFISRARDDGAVLLTGGRRPPGLPTGYFVEPTLFGGVSNASEVAQKEIFGPVVCLIDHDGDDHAVALANQSDYGLDGVVYSSDENRALAVARRLRTGSCAVNDGAPLGAGGPFGGFKASGVGRENGIEGYLDLTRTRTLTFSRP
jgi:betaine-aldehyde dehydrogenase